MNGTYELFAEILDYPGPGLADRVRDCMARLAPAHPGVTGLLGDFQAELEGSAPGRLEEIYTGTFDFQPESSLYAGYHLFGDDHRRSLLLVKLQESYRACGFLTGKELADHLCVLLRFLGRSNGTPESRELISDCLIPALSRMLEGAVRTASPYRLVLEALLQWLRASDCPRETGDTPAGGGKENV